MLKNNKGMTIPLVIITMLILSILGSSLLAMAMAQNKHSDRDESRIQAYYLARSGVEATETWLRSNIDEFNNIKDKTSSPSTLIGSEVDGYFTVKVTGSIDSYIIIEGTGYVNGVNASAAKSLNLSNSDSNDKVFDHTVYGDTLVTLGGNTEIATGSTVGYGNELVLNGVKEDDIDSFQDDKDLPPPNFPTTMDEAKYLDYSPSGDFTLNTLEDSSEYFYSEYKDSYIFKVFTYNNNKKQFTVNTGSEGNIVRLLVKDFDFQKGELVIDGQGRLEIYVTHSMNINGAVNQTGTAKQLVILLGQGSYFNLTGNAPFTGVIYGPEAEIYLGGTGDFTGAVIGSITTLQGTPIASSGDASDLIISEFPVSIINESNYINN